MFGMGPKAAVSKVSKKNDQQAQMGAGDGERATVAKSFQNKQKPTSSQNQVWWPQLSSCNPA